MSTANLLQLLLTSERAGKTTAAILLPVAAYVGRLLADEVCIGDEGARAVAIEMQGVILARRLLRGLAS